MFQQFKNIFPTTSLSIRSITESVGLSETDWNRTSVERFEAIRNEFQNLNNILLNRSDSSDTLSNSNSPKPDIPSVIELEATGNLINKIHQGWDTIHQSNQANFEKAQRAEVLLRQLQTTGEAHYRVCDHIEHISTDIEETHHLLDTIQTSADHLMKLLHEIDAQVDAISVEYEQQEFELWKQQQEKEFMAEIALKRQALKQKENKLREQYEEYDSMQQKKRLELYEANFNAELEDYKRRRETEVSSLYSSKSSQSKSLPTTTLEQLKIDDDQDLSGFLQDQDLAESTKKKDFTQQISSDEDEESRVEIMDDEEDYQDL
ncbi:hypothetical protein A0J61_00457 [Choanephora cucurbitarum]|uniref:Dysbindin n=1 Tax=Choanephora cucurbitarum TaxID=101091 RepID=A0A1C7NQY5_9FUNG|nr:hypothetical protein A0J61_00457 [Choanephora cucurbitarum]